MTSGESRVLFWFGIAGSLASVAAIAATPGSHFYLLGLVGMLLAIAALLRTGFRVQALVRSGLVRFFRSFPVVANYPVFGSVKSEFCYLGVSFDTAFGQFEDWYRFHRVASVRSIRLLLVDPSATEVLGFQARHHGTPAEKVAGAVAADQARIEARLKALFALPDADRLIQVRLHRAPLRHWMHIVDGGMIWAGLLPQGRPGLEAPVMILKPRAGQWTLFDLYKEEFEALWETSTPVGAQTLAPH